MNTLYIRTFTLAAVVLILLVLLGSCSADQSGESPDNDSSGTGGSKSAPTKEQPAKNPTGTPEANEQADPREGPREVRAALVPIVHLTSEQESVSVEQLSGLPDLAVPEGSRAAAEELLGRSEFGLSGPAPAVVDHVSRSPGATGLVPWDAVTPQVKSLAVDDQALFAAGGVEPESYPLVQEGEELPDPGKLRRVVVGGDIVLDRGQSYAVIQQGMGIDFPMDGGYVAITGRTREPNPYSPSETVTRFTAERRGGAGVVREYVSSADLALANLENPVVEAAVWHPEGTTFTGDPELLPILEQAGLDGVTLGNNHIMDAGVPGMQETQRYLEEAGISYTGVGMDLASAREPMVFDLEGVKVGVLNYLDVPSYQWSWATETQPGTAPLQEELMREDIERLKNRVDVVLVMPHWGTEYLAEPEPGQVEMAHAAVEAGADILVGGHAHWVKGMEIYEEKPIFYGVGNFLFDQSWSEATSTGIFAEIMLYGDRPVQSEAIPFVMLDYAQPNFLLPEAGGNRVLRNIFSASVGPEFEEYTTDPGNPQ
ncbi:MAG: CapA family protein [Rubrobacteraceae bacterium]